MYYTLKKAGCLPSLLRIKYDSTKMVEFWKTSTFLTAFCSPIINNITSDRKKRTEALNFCPEKINTEPLSGIPKIILLGTVINDAAINA